MSLLCLAWWEAGCLCCAWPGGSCRGLAESGRVLLDRRRVHRVLPLEVRVRARLVVVRRGAGHGRWGTCAPPPGFVAAGGADAPLDAPVSPHPSPSASVSRRRCRRSSSSSAAAATTRGN